jgi:hypothetical protein
VSEVVDLTVAWAREILDEPEVLGSDNFFDLGGHSMLAVELSARAEARFGQAYDFQVLFDESLSSAAAELAGRIG